MYQSAIHTDIPENSDIINSHELIKVPFINEDLVRR